MTKIAIIVGSTRPGRKARAVADWVLEHANARTDAAYAVVDIAEFDLPLLDEAIPPSMGQYTHQHTKRWAAEIAKYDGFIFVTPEYNHSVPAALKNAVDYLCAEWNDKAIGFVSYGAAGGVRAVEHFRQIAAELKLADVRPTVMLSLFEDFENYMDFAPREHHSGSFPDLFEAVESWSRALATVRNVDEAVAA